MLNDFPDAAVELTIAVPLAFVNRQDVIRDCVPDVAIPTSAIIFTLLKVKYCPFVAVAVPEYDVPYYFNAIVLLVYCPNV